MEDNKEKYILISCRPRDAHTTAVVEELEVLGEQSLTWSPMGNAYNDKFSLEITDEAVELEVNIQGKSVKGSQIKAFWNRINVWPQIFNKTREEIVFEEFRLMFFIEFYTSVSLFLQDIPQFNPAHEGAFLEKPTQYLKCRRLGFNQPDTLISNDSKRVVKYFFEELKLPKVLFKPMERLRIEHADPTAKLLDREIIDNPESEAEIKEVPNCWQSFVRKDTEYRTTAVNNKIYNTRMLVNKREDTKIDFRLGQSYPEIFELAPEDPKVTEIVTKFLKEFKMKQGVFDLIRDPEGEFWFLECNDKGQWMFHTRYTGAEIGKEYALAFSQQ